MTDTKTDTELSFRAICLCNEEMSMERNISDMLPMLLPNDKDDRNSQFKVGQWVDNIMSILTNKHVETNLWVYIACHKNPIEKRYIDQFKTYAIILGIKLKDEYTALFFSDKLPLDVMDKLVANLAPKDTVKFVGLVTQAQRFFHVYKNIGIPMEVNALNTPTTLDCHHTAA
ncbi:hypothetical protein LPJ66_001804 [Kickxella alabastrina]|uniref:Uncharacterized protein n=1 Tax=Kickxella alabastrina TaxID=61397 RepID=A0ACC1IS93_9FUNG|nr:hypothetical protein LPJ66_001804 [Kickxella alabastrina]